MVWLRRRLTSRYERASGAFQLSGRQMHERQVELFLEAVRGDSDESFDEYIRHLRQEHFPEASEDVEEREDAEYDGGPSVWSLSVNFVFFVVCSCYPLGSKSN